MTKTRTRTITQKVQTPFGSMYVHLDHDEQGRITAGSISDPRKEPDAQVARLVEALSDALDQAIKSIGK